MTQTPLNSIPQNFLSPSEFVGGLLSPSPVIVTQPRLIPLKELNDWELAFELLHAIDDEVEYYVPSEVAKVIGHIAVNTLIMHARTIWKDHTGYWKFSTDDAKRLIKKCMRISRQRFPRETLEYMVSEKRRARTLTAV